MAEASHFDGLAGAHPSLQVFLLQMMNFDYVAEQSFVSPREGSSKFPSEVGYLVASGSDP